MPLYYYSSKESFINYKIYYFIALPYLISTLPILATYRYLITTITNISYKLSKTKTLYNLI